MIVLRVLGGAELRAVLDHRDRRDLVADAEPLEERHVERQQRLADVEAGVAVALEHATSRPRSARSAAIVEPAGPPPITSTSQLSAG